MLFLIYAGILFAISQLNQLCSLILASKEQVSMKKKRKGKLVVASGVFDLLHYGHVKYLEEAKKIGGEDAKLIVIVARDSTVRRLKGKNPIISEDQRRALVEALKPVDIALLGYEDLSFEKAIEKVMPDIIAVGYDQDYIWNELQSIVKERKLGVKVVRIEKFGSEELNSSSKIKRKIIEGWK